MIRPTAPAAHRVNARELAAARASRAAAISRRAAAGRRRMLLTGLLIVFAVALWVLAAAGPIAWGWAVPITLLAAGVGYVAVRAALGDRAADAKARAEIARLDQRLRLFRTEEASAAPVAALKPSFSEILKPYQGAHAETPGLDETAPPRHALHSAESVFVELGDSSTAGERAVAHARSADERLPTEGGPEWTPVPVPLPTYTLKAEAPRREAAEWAPSSDDGAAAAPVPARPTGAAPSWPAEDDEDADAAAFVLDDVLARRRAAGA